MINKDLKNLVGGKRVVIVGPAPHLKDSGKGGWISDHDIVIRPNQFHVPDVLKADYGERTDIMSHNFGTPWMEGLKDDIDKYKDQFDQLTMLMCPLLYGTRGKEENYMSWPENHVGDVVHNAQSVNTNKIPFAWIGPKRYQQLYRQIGCQPYTGVLTICMILDHSPKSLDVLGFDFYKTDKAYVTGVNNPKYGPPPKKGGGHGSSTLLPQANFLRNLIQEGKIQVDDTLKELCA